MPIFVPHKQGKTTPGERNSDTEACCPCYCSAIRELWFC